MSRHRALPLLLPILLLAPAGCGLGDTAPVPAGSPAAGPPARTLGPAAAVHVYFYSARGLERVSRAYRGPDPLGTALRDLAEGPDAAERARGLVGHTGPPPVPAAPPRGPAPCDCAPLGAGSRAARCANWCAQPPTRRAPRTAPRCRGCG